MPAKWATTHAREQPTVFSPLRTTRSPTGMLHASSQNIDPASTRSLVAERNDDDRTANSERPRVLDERCATLSTPPQNTLINHFHAAWSYTVARPNGYVETMPEH